MKKQNSVVPHQNAQGVKLWVYRASLVVASVVAVVIALFFFWGLADGSVSPSNFAMWLVALALATAVPFAGIRLADHGHHVAATLVLGILAIPGLLYALFILLVIGSGTRWN